MLPFTMGTSEVDDVLYPLGEVDAITITAADVARLQPPTFLNDTLIGFYLK
jgi:Ulp1 family protease